MVSFDKSLVLYTYLSFILLQHVSEQTAGRISIWGFKTGKSDVRSSLSFSGFESLESPWHLIFKAGKAEVAE